MTSAVSKTPPSGLTSEVARQRLTQTGPNAMPDTTANGLQLALSKFWAPVPWMLEAAIIVQLLLGAYIESAIIAFLLVFNAALGLFQEGRAQATLAALKSRLALNASVRRDGTWKNIPAAELVPGDTVKLSLGAVVAADVRLTGGEVLLDQSMLTGESMPVEAGAGVSTYAGALVRLDIDTLRTLCVVALVFGGQVTMYAVRGRQRFWGSRPSWLLILSSAGDILIISVLATAGIFMKALPFPIIAGILAAAAVFALVLNTGKMFAFKRFQI